MSVRYFASVLFLFAMIWLAACGSAADQAPVSGDASGGGSDANSDIAFDIPLDMSPEPASDAGAEAAFEVDSGAGADTGSEEDASGSDVMTVLPMPHAHLPGTLLLDRRSVFWMVKKWPYRAMVTPAEMERVHLDPLRSILMTADEERCLVPRAEEWRGLQGWALYRAPDGSLWYVNLTRELRRRAFPEVIRAYRDDPIQALPWTGALDLWEETYREIAPMPFPEGTLVEVDGRIGYLLDDQLRPFETPELLMRQGYDSNWAMHVTRVSILQFVSMGLPLRDADFLHCPAEERDPHRLDDEDGDGVVKEDDCNDQNAQISPSHVEICDDEDNNCDGIRDDGFPIDMPCGFDEDGQAQGFTVCDTDQMTVKCRIRESY